MKAKEIYAKWLEQNETLVEEQLKFGDEWVKKWEAEYGVSLRKHNKHYSLSYDNLCVRSKDYLKNVWTVSNFFLKTYGVDPPVINGDQMPLHQNESTTQKQCRSKIWTLMSRKIKAFHAKELLSLRKSPLIQLLPLTSSNRLQGERNENQIKST